LNVLLLKCLSGIPTERSSKFVGSDGNVAGLKLVEEALQSICAIGAEVSIILGRYLIYGLLLVSVL